jgi:hypothetical protein
MAQVNSTFCNIPAIVIAVLGCMVRDSEGAHTDGGWFFMRQEQLHSDS